MKRNWLNSETGITIIAIGIATTMLSLAVFMVEDVSILFRGSLFPFRTPRIVFYSFAAALAALFCAFSVFISRPGLARIIIGSLAVSMASHATEHLVPIPPTPLKIIAAFRIVVSLAVIIPILRFRAAREADNSDLSASRTSSSQYRLVRFGVYQDLPRRKRAFNEFSYFVSPSERAQVQRLISPLEIIISAMWIASGGFLGSP